jgi:acetyl-CoA carboxylase carboxyltransferase component
VSEAPSTAPTTAARSSAASAALIEIDRRTVSWFRLAAGHHRGAIGPIEGDIVERAVRLGPELGVPVVGVLATSGADVGEGVASLHAWGRVARAIGEASGVVPTLLGLIGPCLSGPALLLGLADQVVMTADAFAYVTGPDTIASFTGIWVDRGELGGPAAHGPRTGVAAMVVDDEARARDALGALLSYLPSNHLEDPPRLAIGDPVDRGCDRAATAVPARASSAYDVRDVIDDVFDHDSFLELRPTHAPNLVTGLARLDGIAVGVVGNQPLHRAGTLDIAASGKGARFVQWCDAFNLPLLTFVDTPGFEPGMDLEWRGMIRYGAQLVHAYAAATVPRLCVVLRKAYGGAYIVMDSRGLGNDWCGAWPSAEIAVLGAAGAVQVLHRRELAATGDTGYESARREQLEADYATRFSSPFEAAARGYVDEVLEPVDTRRRLASALAQLATKREDHPARRHSNTPL